VQKFFFEENANPKKDIETFCLSPSSLPSLTCKVIFSQPCAKKFESKILNLQQKICMVGTLCCALRNKKRKHTWKRAFSKSTPVFPRLLWTKTIEKSLQN